MPAAVEQTPLQRVAEAGVLLPAGAAVTGWAALCWLGGRWFTGTEASGRARPVTIACRGRAVTPRDLVAVSEELLDRRDVEVLDGLRVTVAERAVSFEVRHAATLTEAVSALEMAYADDLTDPETLRTWLEARPTYRRLERIRQVLEIADENVWSPQESRMRGEWVAETGRNPLTNRPVFDLAGRHLGTPDLIDPVTGVAGEYDGAGHLTGRARRRDLSREQLFREHGVEPFAVVAGDLGRPDGFRARLRTATERAARLTAADRRWTLEKPDWWVPTETVAQRRALTGIQRDTWLRRRGAA